MPSKRKMGESMRKIGISEDIIVVLYLQNHGQFNLVYVFGSDVARDLCDNVNSHRMAITVPIWNTERRTRIYQRFMVFLRKEQKYEKAYDYIVKRSAIRF